ncbi:hypothetical protein IA57_03985 [Mangrovimonas yunxiaonensis]|uniref:Cytochrome C oxidase subunit IV n=1 Tax=Mangrovimonas yunxiaonensis TaxID=1197477 RepID=A0A084TMU5_9FLAO|nr:cytochrome C oxidase subunit IV family protein [Mangrovimonas yunxiaonensis]KFB02031.1 hypothetical protein IA57_03985 [Mangrovimonas yunxiaonensis]GGH45439.1 hypothetical protein GCM10011364_18860 [Mangrovimonas yunxiaonensis]
MTSRNSLYILIALIVLTLIAALAFNGASALSAYLILLIATIKFNLVGFYFMELKHAHTFWKLLLGSFSIVILMVSVVLL